MSCPCALPSRLRLISKARTGCQLPPESRGSEAAIGSSSSLCLTSTCRTRNGARGDCSFSAPPQPSSSAVGAGASHFSSNRPSSLKPPTRVSSIIVLPAIELKKLLLFYRSALSSSASSKGWRSASFPLPSTNAIMSSLPSRFSVSGVPSPPAFLGFSAQSRSFFMRFFSQS